MTIEQKVAHHQKSIYELQIQNQVLKLYCLFLMRKTVYENRVSHETLNDDFVLRYRELRQAFIKKHGLTESDMLPDGTIPYFDLLSDFDFS